MSIVESLPTYGVHYYAVKVQFYYAALTFFFSHMHCTDFSFLGACKQIPGKFCCVFQDKQGIPWWLGLSYKGIFQYDYQDKVKPRKVSLCFSLSEENLKSGIMLFVVYDVLYSFILIKLLSLVNVWL